MDLGTIRSRLDRREYSNPQGVLRREIHTLMLSNTQLAPLCSCETPRQWYAQGCGSVCGINRAP